MSRLSLYRVLSASPLSLVTGVLLMGGAFTDAWAQESQLWGKTGELWKAAGRLDDFSFAGYHFGEATPPSQPVGASIKDFGAVGDGKTDDTAAFKRAVVEAAGKVILIPAGTYVITDRIEYSGLGTILRGDGRDSTTLHFPKGLEDLYPSPTTNDGGQATTKWSWGGGLLSITARGLTTGPAYPIAGDAARGGRKLTLSSVDRLQAGDLIQVSWQDDDEKKLLAHLYAQDAGDASGLTSTTKCVQLNRIVAIQGQTLELLRPLRYPVGAGIRAEIHRVAAQTEGCGIEDLTLSFASGIYRGHFMERGFNAITIQQNALHCWVRRVRIQDADSGILGAGMHGLVEDVIIEAKRKSTAQDGRQGHHGIDGGRDCLIQDVTFKAEFFHDLSVSGQHSGNVFRRVQGENLSMDHHRWCPNYNLFTNIDLGSGERAWLSGGGKNRGKHTGIGATFWNLRSTKTMQLPEAEFGPAPLQFVGLKVRGADKTAEGGWWVEGINPSKLQPQDLYAAQLARRLAAGERMLPQGDGVVITKQETATNNTSETLHTWTNTEGKSIQAKFGGLQDGAVVLVLSSGQTYTLPLSKLDAASQKQAQELTAGGR